MSIAITTFWERVFDLPQGAPRPRWKVEIEVEAVVG